MENAAGGDCGRLIHRVGAEDNKMIEKEHEMPEDAMQDQDTPAADESIEDQETPSLDEPMEEKPEIGELEPEVEPLAE